MKYAPAIILDIVGNSNSCRSECSCGWKSPFFKSQVAALADGEAHAKFDHHVALQKCFE